VFSNGCGVGDTILSVSVVSLFLRLPADGDFGHFLQIVRVCIAAL
jgi:hypothetical protein